MKKLRNLLLWIIIIVGILTMWPQIKSLMDENLLIREERGETRQILTHYREPYNYVARLRSNISVCTATLIAPKILITAAHCIINSKTNQYFKPHQMLVDFFQGSNSRASLTYKVKRTINTHDFKKFGFAKMHEDWAFIILTKKANIGDSYPIVARNINQYPLDVWQAGFGPDNHEHLFIDEHCRIINKENNIFRTNCLVVPGDSGGPIFWRHDNGNFYIVGVNSALRSQEQILHAFAIPPSSYIDYWHKLKK